MLAAGRHAPPELPGDVGIYTFGVGFAPGLEAIGRVTDGDGPAGGLRDLSLDLKYVLRPLDAGPFLAAGVQDAAGESRNFRARYLLLTWPWRSWSATLGHGTGPDMLDGAFGGVEWTPVRSLSVIADHDASDWNAGLRLRSGAWLAPAQLVLTASYRHGAEAFEGGVALRFPLGGNRPPPSGPAPATVVAPAGDVRDAAEADLAALARRLERAGFESVRVGMRPGGTVVATVENRVYNHSFVDAVGTALHAADTQPGLAGHAFELQLTAYRVPLLSVAATLAPALPESRDLRMAYAEALPDPGSVQWTGAPPAPLRAPEIVLEPALRTFVATESGVLDYALAARARVTAPLARGLLATAGARLPVARSDDFRDGRNFASSAPEGGLDQALLQYFHRPGPRSAWLWSVGSTEVFQTDTAVAALEQLWLSASGRHQWRTKWMAFRDRGEGRTVALAGYTWFDARRALAVSLSGGRYYGEEGGAQLEVDRWFGDTLAGVFFRAASGDDQVGGFRLSLPLTPRRDARPDGYQFKGARRWEHSRSSTLNDASGANPLRPLLLFEPMLDLDLRRDFFDAGRLSPDHLLWNRARLRDAAGLTGDGGSP